MALIVIQARSATHLLEVKYNTETGEPEIKEHKLEDNEGLILGIHIHDLDNSYTSSIRWEESEPFIEP